MSNTVTERTPPQSQPTEHPHVERVPGVCGGRAKIRGHRIPVWTISAWLATGIAAEEILTIYPQLSPAQIHDAISYYYDHREEIDQEREENSDSSVGAGFSAT